MGSRSAIDQMCSNKTVTETNYRKIVENSTSANINVVNAWSRCMGRRGFSFGIKQGTDPKRFSVVMTYLSIDPSIPAAEIFEGTLGFDISSDSKVACDPSWINARNRQINQQRTVTCVRDDPTKPVSVTVNSRPSPLDNKGMLEVPGYHPIVVVPDSLNLKGSWSCLYNRDLYHSDVTIHSHNGSHFSGEGVLTCGPCCVGVVSTIQGQLMSDTTVRFSRSNSGLAAPQIFNGTLTSNSRITGNLRHGDSDYDFSCSRK